MKAIGAARRMKVTVGSDHVTSAGNSLKAIGTADVAGLTMIIDGIVIEGTAITGTGMIAGIDAS